MKHSHHDHGDHDHSHEHDHSSEHGHSHGLLGHFHAHGNGKDHAPRALILSVSVTVVFMAIEFVGGWISNSLALMTDAAHMLTDVGATLLALFAIWLSRRPVSQTMSFGYHRAEILGALGSGLLIWVLSGALVYEAFMRLREPPEVMGPMVLVVATIGLLANLLSMKILHGASHGSMNVRAAYLHMLTDALGSVGAVIAGAVLWLTGWRPIDPIITIFFAILMLFSSWHLVKEAIQILMESTPLGVDPAAVRKELEGISGVREVHDLHIWTVASGRLALSVHIVAENGEHILAEANRLLQKNYQIIHTTIQVEHPERFQSERCYDCTPAK